MTVSIKIYLFEPGTLTPYKLDLYFNRSRMWQEMNILEILDYVAWTKQQRHKIGLRTIPEPITDSKLKSAVQLAKFISFKLYNKVIEKDLAVRVIWYYQSFFQNAPVTFESKLNFLKPPSSAQARYMSTG
jgi:hypothetical protein